LRFFIFNQGVIKPFRLKNLDGVTDKDLTDLTVKWFFKDRAGNVPPGNPILGKIINASQGQVDMTIPSNFFITKAKYNCQLNLTDIGNLDQDTVPFTVDVDNPRSRTV